MNLLAQDLLNSPFGLLAALAIGGAFGFWLERAGFGSSRKLTAIFYLQDFAVLKVMFTAMATAAVSLFVLAELDVVDLATLFVAPTIVWAQLAGGALFGVGFVAGGWCPGTAAVGVASGKLDALVFLLGAGGGSLVFAAMEPQLRELAHSGELTTSSVATELGLDPVLAAFLLLAVAIAASMGATRVERRMNRSNA